ncbi:MAG: DegT/DnrJ/EryC1/StrS family aminotransferase [Bacteroidetes bacterium]|nr:MAG: DegT/DnrJ/EryC1/StrS family aminotransferase [Bacteroidota bacterium]
MIPFSPPRIDQKIIDAVTETLRSGWITTGPKTRLFEKKLEEYCGNPKTLCVNSATSGLELMLRWFGVGPGDEVILPAYTYSATANVIVHCGARPVFVDVENDFNISLKAIRMAITSNTKVIMPVDFGGWPCDYDAINALVKEKEMINMFRPNNTQQELLGRIFVLSDAAHSLGAIYNSKRSGSLTDVSVFSFHAVKNLTTAEGGAIALNLPKPFDNKLVYDTLCIKALHGQNKDALAKMQRGNWRYDIIEPGYKMNMPDILAAIGLVEIERYESDTLARRKQICNYYSEKLKGYSWAMLPLNSGKQNSGATCTGSYHLYPLRINDISEESRDRIIKDISDRDVSVNVHFIPVPMMSYYKNLGAEIKKYPKTYSMYRNEISLPVYYDLTNEQLDLVLNTVITAVENELT